MTVGCPTGADVKTPVFGPSEGMTGMAEAIFSPSGVTIAAVAAVGPITKVTGADPIVALDPTKVVIGVDPMAALDPKGMLIEVVGPTEPPNPAETFTTGVSELLSFLEKYCEVMVTKFEEDRERWLVFDKDVDWVQASGGVQKGDQWTSVPLEFSNAFSSAAMTSQVFQSTLPYTRAELEEPLPENGKGAFALVITEQPMQKPLPRNGANSRKRLLHQLFVYTPPLCLFNMENGASKFKRICVFCGSSQGKKSSYQDAAVDLGKELVSRNIDLVYGGGSIGLMGLVSQAVHDGGRHVIGVIPKTLMPRELTGETVGEVKAVANMHQRKAEMGRHSDAFIALPGWYHIFLPSQ
ncbi:unnamed protein product [Cuscuta campestris]|uniref:cytokinin riboside 5'-monophosphate phosphoribohydrolase n=1 Tax=Cuscuta campestris TaxID=132261 RepID=A0A484NAW4_9ASTE|nr:unnamed protein product [Cuscuta campestris]